MIDHLCGNLVRKDNESVVVRAGGVGFRVETPQGAFARYSVGDPVTILTNLVFRQEGGFALYGFEAATDRQFFSMLVGISGIGPKSALGILSHSSPAQLADAIVREDISTLTKVKGIGKKSAQRIILELAEKIKALRPEPSTGAQLELSPGAAALEEAFEVLVSLGCTEEEAERALESAKERVDLEDESAAERLVMEALQALGSG